LNDGGGSVGCQKLGKEAKNLCRTKYGGGGQNPRPERAGGRKIISYSTGWGRKIRGKLEAFRGGQKGRRNSFRDEGWEQSDGPGKTGALETPQADRNAAGWKRNLKARLG